MNSNCLKRWLLYSTENLLYINGLRKGQIFPSYFSVKSPFSTFFDKPTIIPVDQNYLFLGRPIPGPKHILFQKHSNDSNIGIFT